MADRLLLLYLLSVLVEDSPDHLLLLLLLLLVCGAEKLAAFIQLDGGWPRHCQLGQTFRWHLVLETSLISNLSCEINS